MKKTLLFLMGMLISISIYSQVGAFCEGATPFPNSNSCFNNQSLIIDDVQWYSFVAGETTEMIELKNLDSLPGHIHRIEFYSGTCAGNNLILVDSVEVTPSNDTLLALNETGLTIGNTYYIKLIRGVDGCGKCTLSGANYNLCLLESPVPLFTICGLLPGSSSYSCCSLPYTGPCVLFTICVGTPVELFASNGTYYDGGSAYIFVSSGGSISGNVVTFSTAGTYTVGVAIGTAPTDFAYGTINVVDAVPVTFTAFPNPVCQGQQICFTNTTAPPFNDDNFEYWDFGDGNTQSPPCLLATCDCNTYTLAGTYTVTLTMAGGCPGSVTQEVIVNPPSIKVEPDVACLGNATTFNITMNCIASSDIDSWQWNYGDGTIISGLGGAIPTTYTYSASGSYTATLTVTDLIGNIYVIGVPVNVSPLPPVPIITGTNVVCVAGTTLTYTITNYSGFYTYPTPLVFPIGAATSVSSVSGTGTFTVTWSGTSGGQIAVTVIDPKGCQSTGYFNVLPCCAPPVTIPVTQNFVNSNTTAMIAIGGGYTTFVSGYNRVINKTFYINGIFTVDQNLQLEGCDVFLGPDAKIILNPGMSLIVHNSHMRACDLMWDGIYVSYSNSFVEIRTSIIEDGKNAVVSENGGGHAIRESLFNKNLISVTVRNYSGIFPTIPVVTQITGNSFSCRDYSGLSLATLLAINLAGTYDTYPVSTLNAPHTGERSDKGCEISNITNTTAVYLISENNVFDYLNTGIYSFRSNLKVISNKFISIQNVSGFTAIAAIYAVGKPFVFPSFLNFNLTVGGYGLAPAEGNTFQNCLTGVYTTTNMNVNVYKNDFNFITEYGVRCETSRTGNGINIKNNDIKNFTVGIRCRFNTFCNTQIEENKLKITSSFFFPSSTGIWLEEPSTASTVSDYKVFNNKIQVVKYGIRAFLLNGAILDNNKIELRPSGTTIGIEVLSNYGAQITTNNVQSIPATYTTSVGGIYASMSPLSYIYCNTTKDMGYGIKCAGSMASDIFKNTMQNDFYGFWLDNNGFVGTQDHPTVAGWASYNKWIIPFPGSRCRTSNGSIGSGPLGSPFVYRSFASSQYDPTPSTSDLTAGATPIVAIGTTSGPAGLAFCITVPPPALLKQAQDIAMEMISFPGNDANTKWLSKQGLFHNIKSDSIDVSGDAILQTFVNQAAIENVGKLSEINKTLVDVSKYNTTDMLIAQSLSSSIVPNNDIEANQKLIADIIVNNFLAGVDYSVSQLSDLRILANKCPFTDGIGVYQARVLLSPIDSIATEYANSCETGENRSSFLNSESVEEGNTALMVYPNPASDQLTINYQLTELDIAVFEIYNVVGEKVLSQTLNTAEGEQKLSLSSLNSGVYFYKYSINDRIVRKDKLVIVK